MIQKRVLVAKDALKQLSIKRYRAVTGDLVNESRSLAKKIDHVFDSDNDLIPSKIQLQPMLINTPGTCEVCARGAMMLSCVRKFNDVVIEGWSTKAEEKSITLFGNRNLKRMEVAFELYDRWSSENYDNDGKALAFGKAASMSSPNKRLKAILLNVIKNKGTFKP